MLTQALETNADFAIALLRHYSFDLGGYSAEQLIERWLKDYLDSWVCLAVIEALYQGRYKAVSVEQILSFWQRRHQATYHFNHEFARLVCAKLPQKLVRSSEFDSPPAPEAIVDNSNGYEADAGASAARSNGQADVHNSAHPGLSPDVRKLTSTSPATSTSPNPQPASIQPLDKSVALSENKSDSTNQLVKRSKFHNQADVDPGTQQKPQTPKSIHTNHNSSAIALSPKSNTCYEIEKFIPDRAYSSGFYNKLKALARCPKD